MLFFSLLWNGIITTLLNKPYYFPMSFHYCIWSYDSYIMVIHSLALWSRGLFLVCYLKLVWLISDFEVQWFQWFCIYLLELNVFIDDLLWHFAVDFPGSRWLLGVNHDILESLNSWIIRPKMKCALLLSWETSLHLTSVMQQQGSHSYFTVHYIISEALGNGLACGRTPHLLLGHQMAPKQFVT